MNVRSVSSFIVFATIIAATLGYLSVLGVRTGQAAHRTNISMSVPDANSLVVGSNVLLRGVPVGKVSGIDASSTEATVHFYIDDRFQVPVDSDVRLDSLSALGESYIGLFPRSAAGPMLRDGQHLSTESVIQPPSVSQLVASAVRILQQLDPGPFQRTIDEVDTALPDPGSVLPNLSHTSMLLRNTAVSMQGRGQALLGNLQNLLRDPKWIGPVLSGSTSTMAQMAQLFPPLFSAPVRFILVALRYGHPEKQADGYGDPNIPINFLLSLFGRFQGFLDKASPDIKVLGQALLPHVQAVAGAFMNFDTGQILANMLAAVPEDGAITLHVNIPGG